VASAASSPFVAGTTPAAPSIASVDAPVTLAIVAVTPHGTGGLTLTDSPSPAPSATAARPSPPTSATSPVTVATLTNGNTYTCTALATNALGNSASSAASASFVVATMPDAPTFGSITPGSNAVDVAVTAKRRRRRHRERLHRDVHLE